MIDIKQLRENPELYKKNARNKFRNPEIVDAVLTLDSKWRKLKLEADNLRSKRNKISEEINKAKKSGKNADSLIKTAKEIPQKLIGVERDEKETYDRIKLEIVKIPNLMSKKVPIEKDDSENIAEKFFGKIKKTNFEVKSHAEIAEEFLERDFIILKENWLC